MPPLYNAYKAKLLNVLHSKLCKEKKKKMISLSWATCPFWRKVVYFQGRPAHTYSKWSIFRGDLPTHSHWSIFTGDLPTHTQSGLFSGVTCPHTHTGLFSRATCPHILTLVYFQGWPALLIGFTWDPIWRSNKNKNWCVARSTWNPI
jgi:hypothetical protein